MIGIELLPEGGGARQYCERLMGLGVLCKDTHGHTIRVAPPMAITRQEIDWALERFDSVLSASLDFSLILRSQLPEYMQNYGSSANISNPKRFCVLLAASCRHHKA